MYPCELRADLQETYNLNLDGMGVDYSYLHAAICMSQLPSTSRLHRVINPENEWNDETYFLSLIEYDLRILIWQQTKDAQHNRNKPKPNKTPIDYAKERKRAEGFDKRLVDALLGDGGENG